MKNTKSKFSIDKIKIPALGKVKKDVSQLLNDLQQNKVSLTKESVSDIQEQIILREELHGQILQEMDKIKLQLSNILLSSSDIEEQEKARIRQKQVELEQFKVREKLDKWKDIALLKKELRERIQEFKEKESRTIMLSKLLEE